MTEQVVGPTTRIAGLVVLLAASIASAQSPASPAGAACGLVTRAEAATIMGAPSRAPQVGAFAANTCAIQSEGNPSARYINVGLDTATTLKAQGMPDARQAFEGMQRGADDAEAVSGAGDAAFFSAKLNGVYILKGAVLGYVLIAPELATTPAAVAALKKLAPTIAARM